MSNFNSLYHFIPELLIVILLIFTVLIDLIPARKHLAYKVSLAGLIMVLFLLPLQYGTNKSIFMDLIIVDSFALFFKWIFVLTTAIIIAISKYSVEIPKDYFGEYIALLLMILLGMFLMSSSINLLIIYLSVELVSIPSYILAGIKKNSKESNEASLKYVIFGSFASAIMLFGLSWLYGISGSTNFADIQNSLLISKNPYFIYMSLIFILVGFGYKISVVPFHYWTPDVYEGSPTPVTAFFSIAPKAAGIAILIRTFYTLFTFESNPLFNVEWTYIFAVLSALTMTIGNFLALNQHSVKRLLAYSSISHVGFMLIGFTSIGIKSLESVLLYVFIYFFMNLSVFMIAIIVNINDDAENIDDYAGLGYKRPLISAFMVISLVSLAGLPPTAGYIGKFYLLANLFRDQAFYWLAIIAIINSVVSLYYYFKIIKSMYFVDPVNLSGNSVVEVDYRIKWIAIILSAQSILFYFYWTPILNFINNSLSYWSGTI